MSVPVTGDDELADLGRAFNRMSSELARARDGQRQFLESVSHELKTPLTSVRGYAEALEEGAIVPAEGGRVDRRRGATVSSASSPTSGPGAARTRGFRRQARAGRPRRRRRHEAVAAPPGRAPQELGVALARDGRATARWGIGDAGRLLQATSNLDRERAAPHPGAAAVGDRQRRLRARSPSPTPGPGLAEEDLPRAFERFYLYDRYRADAERAVGSGLGLAVVTELAAAMGGRVAAANRPAGGACFRIEIAAAPAATGEMAAGRP